MTTHDKKGRPWLKLSEAKEGPVMLDSGFTCRRQGEAKLFRQADGALYFLCNDGQHFISGQADDGEYCIGVYKCE